MFKVADDKDNSLTEKGEEIPPKDYVLDYVLSVDMDKATPNETDNAAGQNKPVSETTDSDPEDAGLTEARDEEESIDTYPEPDMLLPDSPLPDVIDTLQQHVPAKDDKHVIPDTVPEPPSVEKVDTIDARTPSIANNDTQTFERNNNSQPKGEMRVVGKPKELSSVKEIISVETKTPEIHMNGQASGKNMPLISFAFKIVLLIVNICNANNTFILVYKYNLCQLLKIENNKQNFLAESRET